MAHNLAEFDGKVAMMYQGETPWHKLGTRIDTPNGKINVPMALEAASLNWTAALHPTFVKIGDELVEIPMRRAVLKDDDHRILATVGTDYEILQYADAFGVLQPAIEDLGLTVEAAGALGKGERAWMLAKLPVTMTPVAGDDVNGYLLITTAHDGSHGYEGLPTPIRVVCQNTLQAAVGFTNAKSSLDTNRIFRLTHSKNIAGQIATVTKLVKDVTQALKDTGETFARMAQKQLTPAQVIQFVEHVFPLDADEIEPTKHLAARRKEVADLVFTGVGAELAMAETGGLPNPWACYNAVTEYFDHVRPGQAKSPKSAAAANKSAVFGIGDAIKMRALMKARALVAA